mmetsp:Transcript_14551/g.18385  ORF Transcript_14551/g.18385 Transcript_14551/m.18385 type:complete len:419 (+) Transcript_14551:120-1376(+)
MPPQEIQAPQFKLAEPPEFRLSAAVARLRLTRRRKIQEKISKSHPSLADQTEKKIDIKESLSIGNDTSSESSENLTQDSKTDFDDIEDDERSNNTLENLTVPTSNTFSHSDEEKCQLIMQSLSESEIEAAARASYEYFRRSETNSVDDDNTRNMFAMKMIRRHIVAEKGNVKVAENKIRKTLEFRAKMKIDAMRQCFYKLHYKEPNEFTDIRKGIDKELKDGKHIVRGHDLNNHAFFIIVPRRYTAFDNEWYLKGKLYSLERALAYTERISGGTVEKINVVFDYENYKADKHEPPLTLIKELMFCLRDHYPERMQHMFFVNAPLKFRAFWTLVKPFIDPVTKRKIQFVSGSQKKSVFENFVSPDQSMRFMHPNGRKPDEYNVERWKYVVPFDHDIDWSNDKDIYKVSSAVQVAKESED